MGTLNRIACGLLLIALLLPSVASAQITFRGRVLDQDGQPVANAQISATAVAMGPLLSTSATGRLETTSNQLGQFSFTTPYPQLLFQHSVDEFLISVH